ncbi:MAG: hypothetical protein HYZ00_05240 [Candidatus Hydrogenedentes bacterium]|nr:hypothetical protein [Candidatus Hydrogenedentota bacterium]
MALHLTVVGAALTRTAKSPTHAGLPPQTQPIPSTEQGECQQEIQAKSQDFREIERIIDAFSFDLVKSWD